MRWFMISFVCYSPQSHRWLILEIYTRAFPIHFVLTRLCARACVKQEILDFTFYWQLPKLLERMQTKKWGKNIMLTLIVLGFNNFHLIRHDSTRCESDLIRSFQLNWSNPVRLLLVHNVRNQRQYLLIKMSNHRALSTNQIADNKVTFI